MGNKVKYDWITIGLFAALVAIGWLNIYSASLDTEPHAFADFGQIYFK